MPKKTPIKKVNKKNTGKKSGLTKLVLIILAIIVALAFIIFSTYTPKRNKPASRPSALTSKSPPSFIKEGTLTINSTKNAKAIILDIEIADNEEERMRGLMDRLSLPENAGMLFIFPNEEPRSFWMKNTFISLDIIYINSMKKIVSIQKYTQPKSTYSIPSEQPAMFVLEVNAGFTDINGIGPGDKVDFNL